MPGPTFLEGERVTLRTVEKDDADFVRRASVEPEIRVPLGLTRPENRHQAEEGIEERAESDDVTLMVCRDDEPMGQVYLMHADWTRPELSYWLAPEYHGQGYSSEAVGLFVDYVFETFEKRGLIARSFETNDGSRGLLETLGFTQEARLRENRFVRGEYVDEIVYGLLREEWED